MILPTKELVDAMANLGVSRKDAISSLMCGYPINIEEIFGDLKGYQREVAAERLRNLTSKLVGAA